MDSREAIKISIDMAAMVCGAYLGDLSNEEMMKRPPGCNHINWQVGHLIASEHNMVEGVAPGNMPSLPDGFKEKYTKETTGSDNPSDFHVRSRHSPRSPMNNCSNRDRKKCNPLLPPLPPSSQCRVRTG